MQNCHIGETFSFSEQANCILVLNGISSRLLTEIYDHTQWNEKGRSKRHFIGIDSILCSFPDFRKPKENIVFEKCLPVESHLSSLSTWGLLTAFAGNVSVLRWNGLATVWFLYTVQRLRNENKVERRTAFVKSKPCVFSHELCGYSCEYTVFSSVILYLSSFTMSSLVYLGSSTKWTFYQDISLY